MSESLRPRDPFVALPCDDVPQMTGSATRKPRPVVESFTIAFEIAGIGAMVTPKSGRLNKFSWT